MSLNPLEIELIEGESLIYIFRVKRRASDGTSSAVNLTGYTITASMRDDGSTTNRLTAGVVSLTDAANGVCSYTFTTTDTALPSAVKQVQGQMVLKLVVGSLPEKHIFRYTITEDRTI